MSCENLQFTQCLQAINENPEDGWDPYHLLCET